MKVTRIIPLQKARVLTVKAAEEEHQSLQENPDFGRF